MIEGSARTIAGAHSGAPTPEQVYGALGCEPRCKGCFPLAERIIGDAMSAAGNACSDQCLALPIVAAE